MTIPMSFEQRTGHLPGVFFDLVSRLESNKPIGSKELVSAAAKEHGINRRRQGYTAAMRANVDWIGLFPRPNRPDSVLLYQIEPFAEIKLCVCQVCDGENSCYLLY
jgi:hypothetical protein